MEPVVWLCIRHTYIHIYTYLYTYIHTHIDTFLFFFVIMQYIKTVICQEFIYCKNTRTKMFTQLYCIDLLKKKRTQDCTHVDDNQLFKIVFTNTPGVFDFKDKGN